MRFVEDLRWHESEVFLLVDVIADEFGIDIDMDAWADELKTVADAIRMFRDNGGSDTPLDAPRERQEGESDTHEPTAEWIEARRRAEAMFSRQLASVYQPVLHRWSDDYEARWEIIREFLRRWHRLELPEPLEMPARLQRAESSRGYPLMRSARHWVRLVDQLVRADVWFRVLRDRPTLDNVPGHDVLALLTTGEDDAYWGYHLQLELSDDPPVYGLHLNYDTGDVEPFSRTPSVSEWALDTIVRHLHLSGSHGFHGQLTPQQDVRARFPHRIDLGRGWLLEDEDIVAFIDRKGRFNAHARTQDALQDVRERMIAEPRAHW